jgi:predicted nicotinamide N-methyase
LDVTFSDYVPLAVDLALENAARNGFPRARGLVLDWRADGGGDGQQFDLVVASDVTYDRTNLVPLLDVLDARLSAGGEAWFGDAGRGPAAEFVERAIGKGWSVSLFDEVDRPVMMGSYGHYRRILLRRSREVPSVR